MGHDNGRSGAQARDSSVVVGGVRQWSMGEKETGC